MKTDLLKIVISLSFLLLSVQVSFAQYSSKKVKSTAQAYTDSLKQVKYDYTFPFLGQGAYKQGFDIPYPVGIMMNSLYMNQGILISNMQLGIKSPTRDVPLTDVDFIQFGDNYNASYSFNVRPDVWLLPFVNVYGLFGYGKTKTEVNLIAPIEMQSIVEQGIRTMGFGIMGAGGVGPIWFSVDANFTWNKPDLVDQPTQVNVLGLRLGHTFVFKKRPDRNFAIWAGGMRVHMSSETTGSIALIDALPASTWEKKDQIVADYWEWYNALDPNNPIDKRKIEKADEVLTPIVDGIDSRDGSSTIRYGMDKQTLQLWNGVIGAQFQLNKHWQFRTEAGVFGDRKSILVSANYRFLL